MLSLPTLLRTSTSPQGSSDVRLSEPPRSRSLATLRAQVSTRPPRWRWPCQPGNTACVCTARTHSCHHHGPAAIWPIVLIACHLHLAEIGPRTLFGAQACQRGGCCRRSSPRNKGDYRPPGSPPPTPPKCGSAHPRCNAPGIVTPSS